MSAQVGEQIKPSSNHGSVHHSRCGSWKAVPGTNRFLRCKRLEDHAGPCSDGIYKWTDGEKF